MMSSTVVRLPVLGDAGMHQIAVSGHGEPHSPRRLLCFPGMLETREGFDSLIRQTRAAQIFALDFAGRGDSDYLPGVSNYRMSGCLRDASVAYSYVLGTIAQRAMFPDLRPLFPFDMPLPDEPHIHLVGNSMGGLIGIFLAAQQPAALRSVVINDVGCLLSWASLITLFGAFGTSSLSSSPIQSLSQGSRQLAERLSVDQKLISAILQPSYLDLPHRRDMAGLNFRQVFKEVDVPVLVIYSADSPIFTSPVRKVMRDLPSNYSFLKIDGKAHPVAYDRDVSDAILRFMDAAEKSSSVDSYRTTVTA